MGNPTLNRSTGDEARDTSCDRWGRRKGNRATWGGVNCLRASLATALGVHPDRIPDPAPFWGPSLVEDYSDELERKLGVGLEEVPAHACQQPRIPQGETWIGCLYGKGGSLTGHAVICRAGRITHDPASDERSLALNGLEARSQGLAFGLRIVSANAPKRDRWGAPIR
jgi:hypothetical protein